MIGHFKIRSFLVAFLAATLALLFGWHQYRTHFGWVLADSGDSKKTRKPRIIIREFLDPILPDEDGVYRCEYWQDHIMREAFSFSSDSVRATSAHLEWEADGSCSAWLNVTGNKRKIGIWHGSWLKS